jgi:hypothetical protein
VGSLIEWLTCPVHGLPAIVMNLLPQLQLIALRLRRT